MTHKERAIAALTCKIPDMVPTFELEFQLAPEFFGHDFLFQHQLDGLSAKEKDIKLHENAEFMLKVYSELEYSIIPLHYLGFEEMLETARIIRKMSGDEFMITTHGDGTFSIPDGNHMYDFVYRIADDPEGVHEDARNMMKWAIESNKRKIDAGIDNLILCSDYCYNNGPFLSPNMFREYVTEYLHEIVRTAKADGAYVIKHTDGNIMPILDQLAECEPHAIHSIDPMAKVDIAEVKRLIGDKICLCGNVNCALMQTGTEEEVVESAMYALNNAKPGGGYIYCTSNVPFRGLPADRYRLVLDVWKKHRAY
ncbi:MAG: uroporphyrinogen decarboxylase family protein [Eubacteriales bacterium]